MAGCTQEHFIGTVRNALANRGERIDLPDDLEIARVVKPGTDIVDLFMKRAEDAAIHAYRVKGEAALIDTIARIMSEIQAKSALIPTEEIPARDGIIARLKEMGIQLCNPNERDAAFIADVGITGVAAAIAETASLCLVSGEGRRRLASLAVPTHIAILRASQILPDLLDWAARQPKDLPANQVLVSAPSKTADIELALVMGVHGPKLEYAIVIE
jgi:L-lactate dehydrogenase complex protein LldG